VEIVNENNAQVNIALSNTNDDECLELKTIHVTDRMRRDLGDVVELAASIKRYGVIQPIVLTRQYRLIAGGRRYAALKLLKTPVIHHGKEYIYNDETNPTRLAAMELEENLKRKQLTWSEEVLGKKQLLEIMQDIKGASRGFGTGKSGLNDGFGIRTLAEMLGENPSTTSRDIQLAEFVSRHPMLASLPTKADAVRKLGVAVTVAAMQIAAKKSVVPSQAVSRANSVTTVGVDSDGVAIVAESTPPVSEERWILYEGTFQSNIDSVSDASVDLVLTDLPYNIGLGDSSASHSAGLGSFDDSSLDIVSLCADVATQSWRVMRDNRFAVFFYGMAYQQVLYDALTTAGFVVDVYPFIWLRDRSAPPDGFARYSKTYDPALIASKGVPRFVRPNLPNSISIPSVRGPERLHAAQKPLALMQKFIEDCTTPGCVVLDMFAGAGTTGAAALQCKRKAILFELEPANCVMIRSRLGVIK
jgi:site-specific DNA-methyltransferase (adenine-specific)